MFGIIVFTKFLYEHIHKSQLTYILKLLSYQQKLKILTLIPLAIINHDKCSQGHLS